jgi:hypothetical protein
MSTKLRRIRERYTRTWHSSDGHWDCWLKIDHQSFKIYTGCTDRVNIQWYARQLAVALERLIDSAAPRPKVDPRLGDKTPEVVEWYQQFRPKEFKIRYGVQGFATQRVRQVDGAGLKRRMIVF